MASTVNRKEEFRELRRILNTWDDYDRYSDDDVIKLLSLYLGKSESSLGAIREKVAKKRKLIENVKRIRKLKEKGGVTSSSSSSDSDHSDDSSSSSSSSDDEVHPKRKSIGSGDLKSKAAAKFDDDDTEEIFDDDDGNEKVAKTTIVVEDRPQRMMQTMKEKRIQRKFMPLLPFQHANADKTKQPLTGSVGTSVSVDHFSAYEGIPCTQIKTAHDVLVYTVNDKCMALPVSSSASGRFSNDTIIQSPALDHEVFQLTQLHHPSGLWFATRGATQLTLAGINPEDWRWELRDTTTDFNVGDFLVHIEPSPFEPGRIAMLQEKRISVWDIGEALTPKRLHRETQTSETFRKCAYGPHPSVLCVSSRTQFRVLDERAATRRLIDVFSAYPESNSRINSDLLTFGRVINRRDEYLLLTRSAALLLDIRFPGKFMCREPHAIPFGHDACHTELVFSKREPICLAYSTSRAPRLAVIGTIPSSITMHPYTHKERVDLGTPMDDEHPSGFRLGNPLTRYDELRQLDPKHDFAFTLLDKPNHKDVLKRVDGPPNAMSSYNRDAFRFSYVLAGAFLSPRSVNANYELLSILGTTHSHLPLGFRRFMDPHLVYRETELRYS